MVFIISLVVPSFSARAMPDITSITAEQKASQLLAKMTPEEKVGQLFLVSFKGTDVSTSSQIYDLVANKHVGGVILEQNNDNFIGPTGTLQGAQDLIISLQKAALENQIPVSGTPNSTQNDTTVSPTATLTPTYSPPSTENHIPLFVGISQEGDGSPNDQLLNGMTPLADEMAIGATWNTSDAEVTGKILGEELNAIGFNLLLGPSLDVLDSTRTVDNEDLGVRTFGGDPYWVGEMGQAYIKGVHEGSSGQIAVIAKNFPGRGSADRPAEDEVATVRKSLEQLKQIELAPFFAVTGTSDPLETTDGLLVSHIRYQGFQGNIRATTKPISLDSTALGQILSLSPLSDWRSAGGIMVSDNLGTASIQKFFDPTGTTFDARQVAKTAFLAGNDLLYLGNLISAGDEDNYTTITKTIDLFLQKYREDQAFGKRVDDSVLRLLTMKFKEYSDFDTATVLPTDYELSRVGISEKTTFQVASDAVTLINPDKSELDSVLPNAPQISERIVFISDVITAKQCSTCSTQTVFSANDFNDAVLRLYGPNASAQIQGYRLSSYSFNDLQNLMNQTGDVTQLQDNLSSADWIIFSFAGVNDQAIGQGILTRFLSEKSDLLRNKRIIGFAFNAPYYLDATDISKFSAYYGIYGKSAPFMDVAARVLFQELIPSGYLPVSVEGVGYDIITATTPDPNQVIQLMVDSNNQGTPTATVNQLSPTPATIYKIGDSLAIRTGIIVDHNGHQVPDGTVVRFMIDTGSTSGSVETVETTTTDGIAKTAYRIPSKGILGITVQADPATVSQTLRLDITDTGGVLTAIEPTTIPTESTPTDVITATPVPPTALTRDYHADGLPSPGDWVLSTLLIIGLSLCLYWVGKLRTSVQWGVRWAILSCTGGYLGYLYIILGLPGSANLVQANGSVVISLISVLGVILGWGAGGIWWFTGYFKESKKTNVTK